MKNLFQNPDQQETYMAKFEALFDKHTRGDLTHKAADLYLSILEDYEYELDVDEIIALAEEHDYDISDLQETIEDLK
jgi:hypothetical protein